MSDVERIAPPVPTLPPPVGRNVGDKRRRPPEREPACDRKSPSDPQSPDTPSDHIDEYA